MKEKLGSIYSFFLRKMAKSFAKRKDFQVIGVTGSVGKTSARMIINTILKEYIKDKKVYTSKKNFNGDFGLALSIFQIDDHAASFIGFVITFFKALNKYIFSKPDYDILFLEYGTDYLGEMELLLDVIKPDISILTNIDKVHCHDLGTPDDSAREAFKLIYYTKNVVFLNKDDVYVKDDLGLVVDRFDYSISGDTSADIYFDSYNIIKSNELIRSRFDIKLKNEKILSVDTNIVGKENAGYISLGFFVLDVLYYNLYGESFIQENKGEKFSIDFELQPGRFSIFEGINDSVVIDSSYNAAPFSMKKNIENVFNMKNELFNNYGIILVLGDMNELGDFSEQEHRKLAGYIQGIADYIFLKGEIMGNYMKDELSKIGFSEDNVKHFETNENLGESLKDFIKSSNKNYIVMFKGSQKPIFLEESIKYVLKNEKDFNNLARQEYRWKKKKELILKN